MNSFFTRLKDAVNKTPRGYPPYVVVVRRTDLRELLHHFERLDVESRRRYYEQQQKSKEQEPKLPRTAGAGNAGAT